MSELGPKQTSRRQADQSVILPNYCETPAILAHDAVARVRPRFEHRHDARQVPRAGKTLDKPDTIHDAAQSVDRSSCGGNRLRGGMRLDCQRQGRLAGRQRRSQ